MPITRGSTPATAEPTKAPSGSASSSRAFSSEAMTSAAAPSLTPLEFPAVTVPPSRNTGRSEPSFSCVVSGRGCSSRSTPFTATSSSEKSAAAQRCCRAHANEKVLILARDLPALGDVLARLAHRLEREHLLHPRIGKRQPSVVSQTVRFPRAALLGFAITSGARVIDSTPPATKSLRHPRRPRGMRRQPSPEAQRQFRVTPATDSGPGEERGHPRDVAVVLTRLVRGPVDVLDLTGLDARPLDGGADRRCGEIVRPNLGERAAVPADRSTDGREG